MLRDSHVLLTLLCVAQSNPMADAPHLIIPTSTLLASNLNLRGYTGPSSPERERRPILPRINSGLLLDTQEFDFDDAIADFAVANDSPRGGIPCDITSPNGGSPSHVLWEPAGCNEEGKLVDQLLRQGEKCSEQCTIKISCKDEGRGSPSKVDADSFEILHMIGQVSSCFQFFPCSCLHAFIAVCLASLSSPPLELHVTPFGSCVQVLLSFC